MTAACAKLICILKIVFACDVCLNWYYLVLPKLLKITLNIINLNIYVYFFPLNFIVSQ
jgi:hypothetical protein